MTEWEDAYTHLRQVLNISTDEPIPKLSRPPKAIAQLAYPKGPSDASHVSSDSKRKAPHGDVEMAAGDEGNAALEEQAKRQRTDANGNGVHGSNGTAESADPAIASARATAAYIPFLEPKNLMPPKMPTREEMENFLLGLRKQSLLEEYFGNE